MEQKRLGLINKAMLVVPGHCLAQAAREFLQLYPNARILVADETQFREGEAPPLPGAGRDRQLGRDHHHPFGASSSSPSRPPSSSEMIQEQLEPMRICSTRSRHATTGSRRKRLERDEGEAAGAGWRRSRSRKDDLLTIAEIGVDQIIVDEAQEFRKLSFATNMTTLKGVDPNGSQRAWDLYVKSRFIDRRTPAAR